MAAPTSYPSYVYNSTQALSQIVATVAAFNALPSPGTWTTTPFTTATVTSDTGFPITDARLLQLVVEQRITNQYLFQANPGLDDPQLLRADVLATDSSTTS